MTLPRTVADVISQHVTWELEGCQKVRTSGTATPKVLRLADWLTAASCMHVAMESTGITKRLAALGYAVTLTKRAA